MKFIMKKYIAIISCILWMSVTLAQNVLTTESQKPMEKSALELTPADYKPVADSSHRLTPVDFKPVDVTNRLTMVDFKPKK